MSKPLLKPPTLDKRLRSLLATPGVGPYARKAAHHFEECLATVRKARSLRRLVSPEDTDRANQVMSLFHLAVESLHRAHELLLRVIVRRVLRTADGRIRARYDLIANPAPGPEWVPETEQLPPPVLIEPLALKRAAHAPPSPLMTPALFKRGEAIAA